MKQNITTKQLNELSEKGKDKLITWMMNCGYVTVEVNLEEDIPLLSIGQMIEFLDEQFVELHQTSSFWGVRLKKNKYVVEKPKELCDALWQAVKEVLEK
jgi:hypothetical protein